MSVDKIIELAEQLEAIATLDDNGIATIGGDDLTTLLPKGLKKDQFDLSLGFITDIQQAGEVALARQMQANGIKDASMTINLAPNVQQEFIGSVGETNSINSCLSLQMPLASEVRKHIYEGVFSTEEA